MLAPIRLLHFDESAKLISTVFTSNIPQYAVLSHTWSTCAEDEFLFEDLAMETSRSKPGYRKILFCSEQAKRDDLQYFWVDTCCIDKWNLNELSNSINSMFRWYKNASRCYVLLSDVSVDVIDNKPEGSLDTSFRESRWFKRGWTLQELIAPPLVELFSKEGERLGDKTSLEKLIHDITGIPIQVLKGDPLDNFSVQQRKAWMRGRKTREPEDMAYSLVGIFDVSMEFRYGEGMNKALTRLEEAIERASATLFLVPYAQNDRFVGREPQLAKIEGKLFVDESTARIAITGPGGVGKTQLALALAYQTRQKHKDCSVFWIPAGDVESLHQAFTNIAQRLNIPGRNDDKVDIKKLVQLYLSNESAGQWLLIFDNADEAPLKATGSPKAVNLIYYLPSSKQGAIIFTTVAKTTAAQLALHEVLELQQMEEDTARRMLEAYLVVSANERKEASALLQELSYLPLAVMLAAAYLKENNITIAEYLTLLASQDKEAVERISEGFNDGWQSRSTAKAIASTWLVSFERIRSNHPVAANQLFFIACIDRRDIPFSVLPVSLTYGKDQQDEDNARFDAIKALEDYSFITKRPHESALDLHRLVYLATRNWLQMQDTMGQQIQAAITQLLSVFPDDNPYNRSKWRRLLPHAMHALSSSFDGQEEMPRVKLLSKCAGALISNGRYDEAARYYEEAVREETRLLGAEHPSTLVSMVNLARTYRNQGQWKEAETLNVQVIETSKILLGAENPDTLTSMDNLASTFWNQGRWEEAEELHLQVIETRKQVLGPEHPDTLNSMDNLASTYKSQGQWKKAEELNKHVIEKRKKVLGTEHPDLLISMSNLASTFWVQGRWKESKELEVQIIETRKRVLGAEHPDTLFSMSNLASTYWNQGRWKEAEQLNAQVMETRKKVLGPEHPDTLTSMTNLASTFWNQGRWKEAEELFVQAIETSSRVLGVEHPSTLNNMTNLASTYWNQGRLNEAKKLEVQVMETSMRSLGPEHPDTLTSMSNLATTYESQGQWTEAEELNVQVMETRKRVLGAEHPDTLISMANLAMTYRNQGRLHQSEELSVQVIEKRKRVLGAAHPHTLTSTANLARTWKMQGRDEEALSLLTECCESLKENLGPDHPNTISSMETLAQWRL